MNLILKYYNTLAEYPTLEMMREKLIIAINEGSQGFYMG
jgi:hypothetical protein